VVTGGGGACCYRSEDSTYIGLTRLEI
jgi:hypothetical protein